ncbi:hypothetical protein J6590_093404 [Homalodisca vitripennis]|nr:hypothetical protein J6590_093404 [Homalodisca vitripennis]
MCWRLRVYTHTRHIPLTDKPLAKKPAQKQLSEQPRAQEGPLQWWGGMGFGVRLSVAGVRSGDRSSGRVPSSGGGTWRGRHHSGGGVFTPS